MHFRVSGDIPVPFRHLQVQEWYQNGTGNRLGSLAVVISTSTGARMVPELHPGARNAPNWSSGAGMAPEMQIRCKARNFSRRKLSIENCSKRNRENVLVKWMLEKIF